MSGVGSNHRYGTWKGLPEASSQPLIRPTQMIAHSIVGSARSAYNYFRDGTSHESHWIFPWDGEAWQLMESNRRADANYRANRWPNGTGALSAETEDNRDPDNQPWTDPQVDRLIDWFRWGNAMFAIPLRLCPGPAEPGIGYHTLWPNHWSKYAGKTCPGRVRIEQFHDLILPALTQPKENDMEPRAFVKAGFLAALRRYPHNEGEMANHLAYLAFHGQEGFLDNLETSDEAKALRT